MVWLRRGTYGPHTMRRDKKRSAPESDVLIRQSSPLTSPLSAPRWQVTWGRFPMEAGPAVVRRMRSCMTPTAQRDHRMSV